MSDYRGIPMFDRVLRAFGADSPEYTGFTDFASRPDISVGDIRPLNFAQGNLIAVHDAENIYSTFNPGAKVRPVNYSPRITMYDHPPTEQMVNENVGYGLPEHRGFLISPYGLVNSGDLHYCHGGGCHVRAFGNVHEGMTRYGTPEKIGQQYYDLAVQLGHAEPGRKRAARSYLGAEPDLVKEFASRQGLHFTTDFNSAEVGKLIPQIERGIVHVDTGMDHLGYHLVAVRDGKQAVPNLSQMIQPRYDQFLGSTDVTESFLRSEAEMHGYDPEDWDDYLEEVDATTEVKLAPNIVGVMMPWSEFERWK